MRRWASLWTGGEAALAVAWAAGAVGLLAHALVSDRVGSAVLAAFAVWQLCHVWNLVHARALPPARERRAQLPPR
jgi:hypothetical protein